MSSISAGRSTEDAAETERTGLGCVGRGAPTPPQVQLTPLGETVDKFIRSIPQAYRDVAVEAYVIMPNHVHLLISLELPPDVPPENANLSEADGGVGAPRPTQKTGAGTDNDSAQPRTSLHTVVRGLKSLVTRACGYSIWQTSYYDHVIRNEADELRILEYIRTNPARWAEDEYYQT